MPAWAAAIPAIASVAGAAISGSAASRAADKASSGDKAALKFEKEKYQDWLDVYGDLQNNLGKYYNSLTPDYYASVGLEAYEKERQTAMARLQENLAQAGIAPSSGLAISLKQQGNLEAAKQRANIRRSAPSMAAEEQRQFLQIGLGQNPGAGLGATLAQQAQNKNIAATNASLAAGQATANAVATVGTALSDYFSSQTTTTTGG